MSELQMSLFGSAPAPELEDAVINSAGVMVGNLMRRVYQFGKAHVTITIGRSCSVFSAGMTVSHGEESFGFCPSLTRNRYDSAEDAFSDQVSAAVAHLSHTVDKEKRSWPDDSRRRREAQELLDAMHRGQYTEDLL